MPIVPMNLKTKKQHKMDTKDITAMDMFSLMPSTKDEITRFAKIVKQSVLNGETDIKKLLYQKSCIEKTLSEIFDDKEVKQTTIDEIEKYGKEGVGYNDAKFEISSRKTWDYSQCGDSQIESINAKAKTIADMKKAREKFLQFIPADGIADTQTGEILFPASCAITTFIKTTFSK